MIAFPISFIVFYIKSKRIISEGVTICVNVFKRKTWKNAHAPMNPVVEKAFAVNAYRIIGD